MNDVETHVESDSVVLYGQAEYLWRNGATTSEMARLLNVAFGRAEQLRKQIALRQERAETSSRRKRRMEQRHIASACGVRSVVGPAADISQAARYGGSLEAPLTHHYDPRISTRRPAGE
jgi:hypothetical protein